MKREDKNLLIRDLCARLPYGVKVYGLYSPEGSFYGKWHNGELIAIDRTNTKKPSFEVQFENPVPYRGYCGIEEIKPYLRPMSSMTEEETDTLWNIWENDAASEAASKMTDFLNKKYLDHHHLIDKGLALEAKEGMYKID